MRVMTRAAAAGAVPEVRAAAAAADAAAAEAGTLLFADAAASEAGSSSRAYDGLVAASSVALASAVIEVDGGRLAGRGLHSSTSQLNLGLSVAEPFRTQSVTGYDPYIY